MAAPWMPRVQPSPRLMRSKFHEWQNRVESLWSLRKQHYQEGERLQFHLSSHSHAPSCLPPLSTPHDRRSAPSSRFPVTSAVCKAAAARRSEAAHFLGPITDSKPKFPIRVPQVYTDRSHVDSKASTKSTYRSYKPDAWKEEIVPVPSGLFTQTQSQLLVGLVSKEAKAYLEQLRDPQKAPKKIQPLKLGARLLGFQTYRPSTAIHDTYEEKMRREQLKYKSSLCHTDIAFGRTVSGSHIQSSRGASPRKSLMQLKHVSGVQSARREVLKSIQEYHINVEARIQLEKRADSLQQQKINFARSSQLTRKSRQGL